MRLRWCVIAMAMVLTAAACSGASVKDSSGNGSGATTPSSAAANSKCAGAALQATETGVTDKTITVTVTADTGSPIRPGLFQGSVDAVKAWANYENDNGGVGCRQVVVKTKDSKLSADEAKNAVEAACTDSIALVATTALFFKDVQVLENCKDKAGKATGLPDIADLQTESTQQCSAVSYAVIPGTGSCPYSGTGPRTFVVGATATDYYLNNVSKDLHGVYVVPTDLTSTIAASTSQFRAQAKLGVK